MPPSNIAHIAANPNADLNANVRKIICPSPEQVLAAAAYVQKRAVTRRLSCVFLSAVCVVFVHGASRDPAVSVTCKFDPEIRQPDFLKVSLIYWDEYI